MRPISETTGIRRLGVLRSEFTRRIRDGYGHRAKDCLSCETKGACCLDAHFVNVRITRLEAAAIKKILGNLSIEKQAEVRGRISATVEKYGLLSEDAAFSKTYACPLFEPGTGCLVHEAGKPGPCIQHACYEKEEHLPPDQLLLDYEYSAARLNRQVYRTEPKLLPLPVWLDSSAEPERT